MGKLAADPPAKPGAEIALAVAIRTGVTIDASSPMAVTALRAASDLNLPTAAHGAAKSASRLERES